MHILTVLRIHITSRCEAAGHDASAITGAPIELCRSIVDDDDSLRTFSERDDSEDAGSSGL